MVRQVELICNRGIPFSLLWPSGTAFSTYSQFSGILNFPDPHFKSYFESNAEATPRANSRRS